MGNGEVLTGKNAVKLEVEISDDRQMIKPPEEAGRAHENGE